MTTIEVITLFIPRIKRETLPKLFWSHCIMRMQKTFSFIWHVTKSKIKNKESKMSWRINGILWNVIQYVGGRWNYSSVSNTFFDQKKCVDWFSNWFNVNLFICTPNLKGNISGMEIVFIFLIAKSAKTSWAIFFDITHHNR